MADINLTITIPDAYVSRFSDVVDWIWAGRNLIDPVPTKQQWVKYQIIQDLKRKVLIAEKEIQGISEIEIT